MFKPLWKPAAQFQLTLCQLCTKLVYKQHLKGGLKSCCAIQTVNNNNVKLMP